MNDSSASLPRIRPQQPSLGVGRGLAEDDRDTNRRIRELLRFYGLRTSLIRLKVIEAMLVAARADHALEVRELHAALGEPCAQLSFISVREVLRRLCEEDVVLLRDKRYSFTVDARAMLHLDTGQAFG
ncbi:fe2+ zn2+ uptake regulation protein [Pseudomonas prosekii]|uniref:fe2+ zn2+ uptake regulation protein n=1 Tax=Pseudomonas prosekii TaxID=1148509 RepID=UPI0028DE7141|nr:fe2+ zn2+ uptake regulation protein [Pseudomonas prosekii]MDT8909065.1 fe2+ zn2+ uptake regulation protein [Pseudomonas prosekii]